MGVGPGLGAIVERTVAENHMRPNGTLGVVVVSGNTRNVEKGEDLVFVFQEPGGKPLPILWE